MTMTRKILGLAALLGVLGLVGGTSAEAATSKKKQQESFAGILETVPGGVSATSTSTISATALTPRQLNALARAYIREINYINRVEIAAQRAIFRAFTRGLLTQTQFTSSIQATVATYNALKVTVTNNYLRAATASA